MVVWYVAEVRIMVVIDSTTYGATRRTHSCSSTETLTADVALPPPFPAKILGGTGRCVYMIINR
jgi:hypothetical protein